MVFLIRLVLAWIVCFGGEVVELEPVKADLNFNCDRLNNQQANCQASPYCYWNSGNCINDPCLIKSPRALANTDDTCQDQSISGGNVDCEVRTIPDILNHDCYTGTPNTGILCATDQVASGKDWDYCAYAYIRDQSCPRSICKVATQTDTTNTNKVGCIKNSVQSCTMLVEADCKLVPKCYWSNSQCIVDKCWYGSSGKDCSKYKGSDNSLAEGDCVDFKPLKNQSTDIVNYCLSKNNKEPNVCYFAGRNASESEDDWEKTYPTYDFATNNPKNPECDDQYPDCEGTGECYTTYNTLGALAGRYCTDGTHGSANVVSIPSVLVFLILSALSIVSIL